METIATVILIVLFLIAYANYRNGSLKPWLSAKFVNSAAPKPAGVSTSVVSL